MDERRGDVTDPYRISGDRPDKVTVWRILLELRAIPAAYPKDQYWQDDKGRYFIAYQEDSEEAAIAGVDRCFKQGFFLVSSVYLPISLVVGVTVNEREL